MRYSADYSFYIDFDGTLVSNEVRLYQFACDYLTDRFPDILSMDEFWACKKLGINEYDIAARFLDLDISKDEYNQSKFDYIEDTKYLELDYLLPNTHKALSILKDKGKLALISRREREDGLLNELDRFHLDDYFNKIVVIKHDGTTKASCISSLMQPDETSYMIGDTEDDIEAARCLDIHAVLVLSGIRSRAILAQLGNASNLKIFDSIYNFAATLL